MATPPALVKKITPYTCLMVLFMAVGIFARGWMLQDVPGGINQDEAFGAYEAYSMLHYGMDSSGYAFPVYLNTWGSGMSALNSYLMIPFIALFGAHTWVIRMPQFLTACFTLYVTYRLLLKLFNQKAALTGLLFLAICPWHIMMSRWGLDCNLAPGFLLFGFYFFVLAAEKPKYYLLSALFYGLSLYCYATIWPIVPLMIFLQLVYLLYTKKLHFSWYAVAAVVILFLLALPLILFMLVNYGYMEEIRTPLLSIPKLTMMRASDISLHNKRQKLKNLIAVFWEQNDGLYWNSTAEFGLYYGKVMIIFAVIGFCRCFINAWKSIREKTYNGTVLLFAPFLSAVLLGGLIHVNVNRINCLHLPVILFMAVGIYTAMEFLAGFLKKYGKCVPIIFVGIACICFLRFEYFYFTQYREKIGGLFHEGLEDAIDYAVELADGGQSIVVDYSFNYPKVLFYSRLPVTEYRDTVEYVNYPSEFLLLKSCGPFQFGIPETLSDNQIYIVPPSTSEKFLAEGFQVKEFKNAAVASGSR